MALNNTIATCIITLLFGLAANAQCNLNVTIQLSPDTICSGTSFTLAAGSDSAGVSYEWVGPNSFVGTNQTQIVNNASALKAGSYKVVATKTGCPSDSDSVNVMVRIAPSKPALSANSPICIGDTLKINIQQPGGQTTIKPKIWGPAAFSDTLFATNIPNASKANAGQYLAVFTDSFRCVSDTGSINIPQHHINTRPDTPVATTITPICKGDTLKLFGAGGLAGETYNWSGPGSQFYNTKDVAVSSYNMVGKQYFLLTVDSNGCHSVADTIEFDVHPSANPKVTISANPGFFTGIYTPVTLTANPIDTGANVSYQWRKNGIAIPGATAKTHVVIVGTDFLSGDFVTVWISTGPTCAGTDTAASALAAFTINTGISNIYDNEIVLHPNPVHDVLTVNGINDMTTLSITNITGQIVYAPAYMQKNEVIQINTTQLLPGMYILRADNKVTKFIKQ